MATSFDCIPQAWEQKLIKNKEDQGKGAKRGKNSWGVGGAVSPPPQRAQGGVWGKAPEKLAFLRFIIVKNAISLQEMQDIPDR